MAADKPLWTPSEESIERANVTQFARMAIHDWGLRLNTYPAFYRWSVDHPEQFWRSVWKFCGVRGEEKTEEGDTMRIPEITPAELKEKLDAKEPVTVLDVRPPEEFAALSCG